MRTHLVGAIVALALGACDASPESPGPASAPAPPQRIVALGEDLARVLVALGLGPRIVGADPGSLGAPELAHALDVGPVDAPDPHAIARLEPDLVLVLGSGEPPLPATLPVHAFDPADADGAVRAIQQIGRLTGTSLRADALVARMGREVAQIATRRDGRSRLRVVWLLDRDPLLAVGGTGMLHQLLELAGAENAFHDRPEPRRALAPEELAAADADRVLGPDPALARLPLLDLPGRVRALHAALYPPAAPRDPEPTPGSSRSPATPKRGG